MTTTFGGGALTKQISASHVQPRNIDQYHQFFRQSSNRIEGWLSIRHEKSPLWDRKWVTFEDAVGDGSLKMSNQKELIQTDFINIALNDIVSFRIDSKYDDFAWLMTYRTPQKAMIYFRADSKDEMSKWVFAYQKSIALVLTSLIQHKNRSHSEVINVNKRSSGSELNWGVESTRGLKSKFDFVSPEGQPLYHINSTNIRSMTTDDMSERESSGWDHIDHNKSVLDLRHMAESASNPIPIRQSPQLKTKPPPAFSGPIAITPDSDITIERNNFQKTAINHTPRPVVRSRSSSIGFKLDSHPTSFDNLEGLEGFPLIEPEDFAEEFIDDPFFPIEYEDEHSTTATPSRPKRGLSYTAPALKISCGACTKKGAREYQEDRFVAFADLDDVLLAAGNLTVLPGGVSYSYFGVYDGHSGAEASSYLESQLHLMVCEHPAFLSDTARAITETCISADKQFLEICKTTRRYAGTTATGAFLVGSRLTVFNIGDCQVVLSSAGIARLVLPPHKPNREDESQRIKAANGWITEEKELFMGRLHRMDLSDDYVVEEAKKVTWVTNHRVCGELAVSRSIGDPDYKMFTPGSKSDSFFLWPDNHNQIFYADLVIPDPECVTVDLTAKDEFLIMASDGLWDVVSSEDAVAFVKRGLAKGKTASETAEDICELALRLGSGDNVTIVIVLFINDDSSVNGPSVSLM